MEFLKLIVAGSCIICAYSDAQVITPIKNTIDFGTIALADNSASYQLRVRWNGQVVHDPQIIIVSQPSPAEFELSEFPVYTSLAINVIAGTSETTKVTGVAAVEQFTISNFDYLPSQTTDAAGMATIYLGATLTTSGSNSYTDGMYNLPLTLEVNF
ncbi:MAG: DUF4402 domain-containing protein [Alteromonadaceae bacterium]|nr:DUF4402 domain-containing protein [Alteromonadaceae bacterium]